jgi:hypothetical protein
MNRIIQFTADEEIKALAVLLRHSPGTVLPNRTYVVADAAAQALKSAGITYREITPQLSVPTVEGLTVGERV